MKGKLRVSRLILAALLAAAIVARAGTGEEYSGGATTVFDSTENAFGFPARNLSKERRRTFFAGNSFFRQNWVIAPASTASRDGLGPLFIARSCSSCHFKDGRGRAPQPGDPSPALILRFNREDPDGRLIPHPVYGDQLQTEAVPGVLPEGRLNVHYEEIPGRFPDGEEYTLRRPIVKVEDWSAGDPGKLLMSARLAQPVFGVGLLEAIPEEDILVRADPEDRDGDGVSGRPNYVENLAIGGKSLGRFGWKANQPTVAQQTASAFAGDMGITSPLVPGENHSESQVIQAARYSGGTPEIDQRLFEKVHLYMMTLAVPARRNWTNPGVIRGKELFEKIGCTSCHVAEHRTGTLPGFPELSDQTIRPYTDLLLHDMGPELADGRPDGEASGSEWRTQPLWGIGLTKTVTGTTDFLHDGRARNLQEAILWHGGEAAASRDRYKELPAADRTAVLRFLESL